MDKKMEADTRFPGSLPVPSRWNSGEKWSAFYVIVWHVGATRGCESLYDHLVASHLEKIRNLLESVPVGMKLSSLTALLCYRKYLALFPGTWQTFRINSDNLIKDGFQFKVRY